MMFLESRQRPSSGNNILLNSDASWMRMALDLAHHAATQGEVPIGAVLVSQAGELLGRGWNQSITTHDPSAHAEIIALRAAANLIKNHRVIGSTVYVTLEPCCMCAGALIQGRVSRLVFAARDLKAGAAGSVYNLLKGNPLNHRIQIDEGLMAEEALNLLTVFFKARR